MLFSTNRFFSTPKMFFLCSFVLFVVTFNAQIFAESLGVVSATTTISSHETANGFDNDAYTMDQGGVTNAADIRNTSASAGYTGASGNANVFFTSTSGEYGFAIKGINASSCTSLTMSFGVRKEGGSGTAFATLILEYSTDNGGAWTGVTYTPPSTTLAAGWYLISGINFPVEAQVSNLWIRFRKTGTIACRLDDIILSGACGSNSITTGSISTAPFSVSCSTGTTGTVAFTSTGTFSAGNTYTAQLSNSIGSFASPTNIGSISSTSNNDLIGITIPAQLNGTGFKIRIISSNPIVTGSESLPFTVNLSGGPCSGTLLYYESFHQSNMPCCDGSDGTAISTHETYHRFEEDALTYTGSGDMKLSSQSSGYTGSSAGYNVMLNNSGENLIMSGLDLTSCSSGALSVSFGVKKGNNTSDGSTLSLEYSTAGSGGPWTSVSTPSLPTGTGTSTNWYLITSTGTIPSNANALRWVTSDNTEFRLDDISIYCSSNLSCTSTTQPTTNASSISTIPYCNSVDISFTAGNGNTRMIVMSADCMISDPSDLTKYIGQREFGQGGTTGSGDFVVYIGSGNSVNVFGLQPSTNYCFKIYEFNKGTNCSQNYLISSVSQTTFTTSSCSGAYITGVMINSCAATCSEGDNEIVYGNTGSSSLLVNSTNLNLSYGFNQPFTTATDEYTQSLTGNTTTTTNLNSLANCGSTIFYDGLNQTLSANSSFMIVRSTFCPSNYDWTSFCASGPIYVIYTNDVTWGTSGNFSNNKVESHNRFFKLSTINTSGVSSHVINVMNSSVLVNGSDGDYVTFDQDGGYTTGSYNNGCAADPIILPIELTYFYGSCSDDGINIYWQTASESNNSHFTLLKTKDGKNYEEVTRINGQGTNAFSTDYFYSTNKTNETFYYRLKQTDYNGNYSYSDLIAPSCSEGSDLLIYPNPSNGNFIVSGYPKNAKLFVLNDLGQQILSKDTDSYSSHLDLSSLADGFYFLKVCSSSQSQMIKLILNK